MADITGLNSGNVNDSGKVNWAGDQVAVPQGGQSVYKTSSVRLAELGSSIRVGDRKFKYSLAGGSIGAGDLTEVTNSATAADHAISLAAAATAGDKTINWTATTTAPKDQFAEGYFFVHSGSATDMGYLYRIKSHAAISSAGTGTMYLYDSIAHPITTTDKCDIVTNKYKDLLECTAAGNIAVGVAPIAVVSSDYFWLQTHGPAAVKCSAATEGEPMMPAATGQADVLTYSDTGDGLQTIGVAMQAVSNSTYGLIFLTIEQ